MSGVVEVLFDAGGKEGRKEGRKEERGRVYVCA